MTRLQTLIAEAEASLPDAEQALLADIIETFIFTHTSDDLFTPEELEDLKRIDGEPVELASPEEVAAVFARRG